MSGLLPPERRLIDLAAPALGGEVLYANDEFFAPASRLLLESDPEWREGAYTDEGKWMDGWETRRRREPGHDYCIIALGARGRVRRARVETTHFRGNQPEAFSLHGVDAGAARSAAALPGPEAWRELHPRTPLGPDASHDFELAEGDPVTHVRFSIHPDGGVARLRLLGVAAPAGGGAEGPFDLAALAHGGLAIAVSDATFGEPQNLLLPEPATHMGQGWETRRRRGPGHDWVVIRLGRRGSIDGIRLETHHFKGNYPESASLDWYDAGEEAGPDEVLPAEEAWRPLLGRMPLGPHATHQWIGELGERGPATHVRLNIFPDGGVARLRVFGRPDTAGSGG